MDNNQIKINCSYTKLVSIADVKPNPRNPNRHPDSQIELLAKIIKEQGFRASITVSNRSGFVVRGHGRLMAAQKLELTEVPIDFQDYESDKLEKADLLADNKIAELANLDIPSAATIIQELDFEGFDLELTAFDAVELDSFLSECIDCDKCENRESPETDKPSSAKKNEVKNVDINSFDYYTIGFSGGKDSTALLLWALDNLPKEKIIVIHYDNAWCFPQELEYVKYFINKYKIKTILYGFKTRKLIMETAKKKGYPFYGNLWCQIQKQRHIAIFHNTYLKQEYGNNCLDLIGIRQSESKRRSDYPFFYYGDGFMIHCPIKDWTDEDVIKYIESKNEKISSLYHYMSRTGCVFCPNHSKIVYKYILENMPEDFCDMNYIIAHDIKKHPQYRTNSIDRLLSINLCREIKEKGIKKAVRFKKTAFESMDFMKDIAWDKECIIDLRDNLPAIKAIF